jgi:hypothetical protein
MMQLLQATYVNQHREIRANSSVITEDRRSEPRFCGVSMTYRCDDGGFSWVEGVGESEAGVPWVTVFGSRESSVAQ